MSTDDVGGDVGTGRGNGGPAGRGGVPGGPEDRGVRAVREGSAGRSGRP